MRRKEREEETITEIDDEREGGREEEGHNKDD